MWDVLEDQDAVDLVREHLRGAGAGATKTAAQLLVDTAIAKQSSDNITALIVML